jgi:hypothetical protein
VHSVFAERNVLLIQRNAGVIKTLVFLAKGTKRHF